MAYFSIFAKGTDLQRVVEAGIASGAIESLDCLMVPPGKGDKKAADVRIAMALCFRVACFDNEDELYGFVRGIDAYLDPQESKMAALMKLAQGDFSETEKYFDSADEDSGYRNIVFLKNLEHDLIIDVLAIIRRFTGTHISYNGNSFISMETGFMPIRFGGEFN